MPTLSAEQLELHPSAFPPDKLGRVKSLQGNGPVTVHFYPCHIPPNVLPWWNELTGRDIMGIAAANAVRRGFPTRVQQVELHAAEGRTDRKHAEDGVHLICPIDISPGIYWGRLAILVSDFLRANPHCECMELLTLASGCPSLPDQRFRSTLTRRELGERRVFIEDLIELDTFGIITITLVPYPRSLCQPNTIVFEMPYCTIRAERWTQPSQGPTSRFSLMWSESELEKERGLDEIDDRAESSLHGAGPVRKDDSEEETEERAGPSASTRRGSALVDAGHMEAEVSLASKSTDVRRTLFPSWFASGEGKEAKEGSSGKKRRPPSTEPPSEDEVKTAAWRLGLIRERTRAATGKGVRGRTETAWVGVVVGSNADISGTGV